MSRLLGGYQQRALEVLRPTQRDVLLDVGCGTGAAVRKAAGATEVVVGIDACTRMIDRAQQLGTGQQGAAFMVATADMLPFGDDVFTALLCTSVMRHVKDRTAVVREMVRVLAPGGRLVLGDFEPELTLTGRRRSTRRRIHQAVAASLPHAELRTGPHVGYTTMFGPYLVMSATKVHRIPHRSDPSGRCSGSNVMEVHDAVGTRTLG